MIVENILAQLYQIFFLNKKEYPIIMEQFHPNRLVIFIFNFEWFER